MSLDEFLAWEERQPLRHEFVGGVVTAMAGGTADHNQIAGNVYVMLRVRLAGRSGCRPYIGDMKVLPPTGEATYPDVAVVCPPPPGQATTTETPSLVVEVLSRSTRGDDSGRKRWGYYAIPTLRHYLLVDQLTPRVEVASREADGTWRSTVVEGLERLVELPGLDLSLPMAEIFEGVEFAASPAA